MTSSMGQKRWIESWSGGGKRQNSVDCSVTTKPRVGSEVSSLTDYSLDRPNTRDTSLLLREHSTTSSHMDSINYQEKLQGWSAVFHDGAVLAPRPGTSLNSTRPMNTSPEIQREISFLNANRSVAFPAKPRELYNPLEGIMPSNKLVSQRKYYVLPSIQNQNDLFLPRQHSNVETLNQLDYARNNYEDDAEFFAELIELKRDSAHPHAHHHRRSPINPLPPIQKLRDVVRPRTNIAELDEDHLVISGETSPCMSVISDVEEFRGQTPDPDYADTSPRKLSCSSQVKTTGTLKKTTSEAELLDAGPLREESIPASVSENSGNG